MAPKWALPEWDLENMYALQQQRAELNKYWRSQRSQSQQPRSPSPLPRSPRSPSPSIDLTPEMTQLAREVAAYKASRKRKRDNAEAAAREAAARAARKTRVAAARVRAKAREARKARERELAKRVVGQWRARATAVDPRTLNRIEPANKVRVGGTWQSASGIGEGLRHGLYRNALTQTPLDERLVFQGVRALGTSVTPETRKRLAAERGERARHRAIVGMLPPRGTPGYGAKLSRLVEATPARRYTATLTPVAREGGPSVTVTSDGPVFELTGLRPRARYVARVGGHMHDGTYVRGREFGFTSGADGTHTLKTPEIKAGKHERAPMLPFPST